MHNMKFIEKYDLFCKSKGTSPFKVAQETGESTGFTSEWMNGKRVPTADRAMRALKKYSSSEILGIDFPTLALWWAMDYLPKESFGKAYEYINEITTEDRMAEAERRRD